MALTFPRIGLDALVGFAPSSLPFTLEARVETSRTAGGVTLAREIGPPLWRFDLRTAQLERRRAMAVLSWLQSLDGPVRTLQLWDPSRPDPAADTGASLAAVQIASVLDGRLVLKGLPVGFRLTAGDLLAFDWGSGPRRALHEVAEDVTRQSGSPTVEFEVRPHVRGAPAADTPVTLRKAAGTFRLVEWSAEPVGRMHMAFSLKGEQVV